MTQWRACPRCGAVMVMYTGHTQCPVCGYRYPAQTITVTTGTSTKDEYARVIRCGVCLKKRHCILYRETNDEDGFCSWAERKEE